jgi:hypothetical protein
MSALTVATNVIRTITPLTLLESATIDAQNGKKVLRITGIFQKADERNQNGRVYPLSVMQEAVDIIQPDIKKRAVVGEFDHPSDAKLHLDRISHVITKLWMEGKNVYGVAEILEDMPCGKMLATLFRNNIQVGISSRGVGEMEEVNEGQERVQRILSGYRIVSFDAVAEPSIASAVLQLMEGKNILSNKSLIVTRKNRSSEAALVSEIRKWLRFS